MFTGKIFALFTLEDESGKVKTKLSVL